MNTATMTIGNSAATATGYDPSVGDTPVELALTTVDRDIAVIGEHLDALFARLQFVAQPVGPDGGVLGAPSPDRPRSPLVDHLGMTHERLLALLNRIDDVASRLDI